MVNDKNAKGTAKDDKNKSIKKNGQQKLTGAAIKTIKQTQKEQVEDFKSRTEYQKSESLVTLNRTIEDSTIRESIIDKAKNMLKTRINDLKDDSPIKAVIRRLLDTIASPTYIAKLKRQEDELKQKLDLDEDAKSKSDETIESLNSMVDDMKHSTDGIDSEISDVEKEMESVKDDYKDWVVSNDDAPDREKQSKKREMQRVLNSMEKRVQKLKDRKARRESEIDKDIKNRHIDTKLKQQKQDLIKYEDEIDQYTTELFMIMKEDNFTVENAYNFMNDYTNICNKCSAVFMTWMLNDGNELNSIFDGKNLSNEQKAETKAWLNDLVFDLMDTLIKDRRLEPDVQTNIKMLQIDDTIKNIKEFKNKNIDNFMNTVVHNMRAFIKHCFQPKTVEMKDLYKRLMSIGGIESFVHRQYLQIMLFGFSIMMIALFDMLRTNELRSLFKGGSTLSQPFQCRNWKAMLLFAFAAILALITLIAVFLNNTAYVRAKKKLTFQSTSSNDLTS